MIGNSKLRRKDELCIVLRRKQNFISNQEEVVHWQLQYTLYPPVHTIYGKFLQTLYFSYILKNLAMVKNTKLTMFFFLVAQLYRKKSFQLWHWYLFFRIFINGCIWIKLLYSRKEDACVISVTIRHFLHVKEFSFFKSRRNP